MKTITQKLNTLVLSLSLVTALFIGNTVLAQPTNEIKEFEKTKVETLETEEEIEIEEILFEIETALKDETKYFVLNENLEVVFEGSKDKFNKKYKNLSLDLLLQVDNQCYFVQ